MSDATPEVIALGIVLILKILWDILFKPKNNCMNKHCEEHEGCLRKIDEHDKCLSSIKIKQATYDADIRNVLVRLEEGNAKFEEFTKEIAEIGKNIAVMAHIIKEKGININK